MARYCLTVGSVIGDAVISGVTWSSGASVGWIALSATTSLLGMLLAANVIANGLLSTQDDPLA